MIAWVRQVDIAAAMVAAIAVTVNAQAVRGTVRTAESAIPMPYSVVAIPSLNREEFTNDHGGFFLRGLPTGPVTLRFRHIGFAPRDSAVVLKAGDTLTIDITLSRLAIQLDAMHVTAACKAEQGPQASAALAQLFEQVRQNALQFALLVRSHPFTKRITRARIARTPNGKFATDPPEVVNLEQTPDAHYAPGKVFRPKRGINWLTGTMVALPVLGDFADSVFIANHCFAYGGDTTLDAVKVVRVNFAPIEQLKAPDIVGTVYLRADGYAISAIDMKTTGVPKDFADDVNSIRVVTLFQDILPGIAVIGGVESYLTPGPVRAKAEPNIASRGEIQMLVEVTWKNGPP
jgi:hypothetical protein